MNNQKKSVLEKTKEAYQLKLFAATSGNLSVYDRETGKIIITPSSIPYETMTENDLIIIDIDGNVLEGNHKPSSEFKLHLHLYKTIPNINGIIHTHSPKATAFAVVQKNIPVILIEMMFFLYGDVPIAAYAQPGSLEVGINAAKALNNRTACLLANHGVVAVGQDLNEALVRATYVEDAAKIYETSRIIGTPIEISMNEQNKIRRKMGIPLEGEVK